MSLAAILACVLWPYDFGIGVIHGIAATGLFPTPRTAAAASQPGSAAGERAPLGAPRDPQETAAVPVATAPRRPTTPFTAPQRAAIPHVSPVPKAVPAARGAVVSHAGSAFEGSPPVPDVAALAVSIQPLGRGWSPEETEAVRAAIDGAYGFDVQVLPEIPLPPDCYYPPRRRYRADRLLSHLARRIPPGTFRVLGVTRSDISATHDSHEDWGVIGLASYDDPAAVISSFRAGRTASGRPDLARIGKVAIHEIGHTLGLKHCATPECLMRDAEGSAGRIDHETCLCEGCRAQLERAGFRLGPLAMQITP